MKCGEQLPQQLSDAIFPSPQSANSAQYVDAPQTRPFDYSVFPFRLTLRAETSLTQHPYSSDCDHCVQTATLNAQLDPTNDQAYLPRVYSSFMRALRSSKAYTTDARTDKLVPVDNPNWQLGEFTVNCLSHNSQVIRHKLEGSWRNHNTESWWLNHSAVGDDVVQTYLFAIPCDDNAATMEGTQVGSGVPVTCSSTYDSREREFNLGPLFRTVQHWPPLYDTQDVAYGFVHRWIVVRHGPIQAVLARVGILSSEKSDATYQRTWVRRHDAAAVQKRILGRPEPIPDEARKNLFIAGQHIRQRIILRPIAVACEQRDVDGWAHPLSVHSLRCRGRC